MTKTSNSLQRRSRSRSSSKDEPTAAPPASARDLIRERLAVEIDRLNPLEDTRRAVLLIGESSIVAKDAAGTLGFEVVGPDGRPRTAVRDGRPSPFTLADLAADIRNRYPALFQPTKGAKALDPPAQPMTPAARRGRLALDPSRRDARTEPDTGGALESGARIDGRTAPVAPPETQRPSVVLERATPFPDRIGGEATRHALLPRTSAFRPTFAAYAGLLLLILAAAAYTFSDSGGGAGGAIAPQPVPQPAPRTDAGARDPPDSSAAAPTASTAPTTEAPQSIVAGVPEVVDSVTIKIDRRIVRLFGVEWYRGARAEDLTRYIAGRSAVCEPVAGSARFRCRIDGRDLSEVVLFNGGGRATDEATPELKAAERSARASGFGVWQKP